MLHQFILVLTLSLFITPIYAKVKQEACPPLVYTEKFSSNKGFKIIEKATQKTSHDSPIVFALHGLGDRIENFSKIHRFLPQNWRIIFVEAPIKYSRGFAWYRFRCMQSSQDVSVSVKALNLLVSSYRNKYQKAPIGIFGFSQGGVMTLRAIDSTQQLYQGAVSLSGYWLKPPKELPKANRTLSQAINQPKILMSHGSKDQVIPISKQDLAIQYFKRQGYEVYQYTFDGKHQITSNSLQRLVQFFKKYLR